jgi:hypothetical protein
MKIKNKKSDTKTYDDLCSTDHIDILLRTKNILTEENDLGNHKFNPENDRDLREKYLSSKEMQDIVQYCEMTLSEIFRIYDDETKEYVDLVNKLLNIQRRNAFNVAFHIINLKLSINLMAEDFTITKFDKAKLIDGNNNEEIIYMPVEIERILLIEGQKYCVQINIDNTNVQLKKNPTLNGPRCPHVGYEIKSKQEHIVGHILIDKNGNEFLPTRSKKCNQINDDSSIRIISIAELLNGEIDDYFLERIG